jgi:glutathione peroxidase
MTIAKSLVLAALSLSAASAFAQSPAPAAAASPLAAARPASCPAVLKHTFNRLQDEAPQDLCQYSGKVVLVVNTASYCGYTPQYEGLEALYAKYAARGLVVLGFPSNDFKQESGGCQEDRRPLLQHLRREVPDVRQAPWCPAPTPTRCTRA